MLITLQYLSDIKLKAVFGIVFKKFNLTAASALDIRTF